MIHYVVKAGRQGRFLEYLDFWGRDLGDRVEVVSYESLPDRDRFAPGTYILASLERLRAPMLRLVVELHRRLEAVEGFRFLNHPTRTMRRFELLTELHRRGGNAFRAVRAHEDLAALRYPVFLRSDRSHDGALSSLLGSPAEVEAAIGRALLQCRSLRDLLVVEFCSTADREGYYRKYAAFVVGDRVIPRSLAYGRDWMLKFRYCEFSKAMVLEERDYVFENPHGAQLAEICALAGVGYGRIDYGVKDGRVQTWEINLQPTIGRHPALSRMRLPPELESIRQQTKERFYTGFLEALEAVDLPPAGPPVAVEIDEEVARAARSRRRPVLRPTRALARLLGPAGPVLQPAASGVLRLLGRLGRRMESGRR